MSPLYSIHHLSMSDQAMLVEEATASSDLDNVSAPNNTISVSHSASHDVDVNILTNTLTRGAGSVWTPNVQYTDTMHLSPQPTYTSSTLHTTPPTSLTNSLSSSTMHFVDFTALHKNKGNIKYDYTHSYSPKVSSLLNPYTSRVHITSCTAQSTIHTVCKPSSLLRHVLKITKPSAQALHTHQHIVSKSQPLHCTQDTIPSTVLEPSFQPEIPDEPSLPSIQTAQGDHTNAPNACKPHFRPEQRHATLQRTLRHIITIPLSSHSSVCATEKVAIHIDAPALNPVPPTGYQISTSLSITSKDITAANREDDREPTDVPVEQSAQEECLYNGTKMDRMDIDEDLDKGTKRDQMDVDEDYDGGSFKVLYVPDGEVGSELEASDVESDELLHEDTELDDRLVEVPSYRQPQHNTLPSPRKHSNIFRNAQASTGRRQVKARSGPVVEAKRATMLFRPNDLNVESIKRPYSASDSSKGRTTSSTKYSSVGEKAAQVPRVRARIGENIARGWKASLVQFLRAIEGQPPSRPTNNYCKVLQEAEETMNDIDSQKMIIAPDVFIDSGLAELLRKARLRRVDERRLDAKARGIMEIMRRISDVLESRIEREGRRWT